MNRPPITLGDLRRITEFGSHCPQCSQPNIERAMDYIQVLLQSLRFEKEDSVRYLGLLQYKIGDEEQWEDMENTMKAKQAELEILQTQKAR